MQRHSYHSTANSAKREEHLAYSSALTTSPLSASLPLCKTRYFYSLLLLPHTWIFVIVSSRPQKEKVNTPLGCQHISGDAGACWKVCPWEEVAGTPGCQCNLSVTANRCTVNHLSF